MFLDKPIKTSLLILLASILWWTGPVYGQGNTCKNVFPVKQLKPRDSETMLKIGDKAPDFSLGSVGGERITLSHYAGKQNVVISFVPAAWTPVCSLQWPAYDKAKVLFDENNAVLLGITVDNIPSLYAWTKEIAVNKDKMWFPVLSDFFPHGQVAKKYGILRSEGFTERALFVIDKKGIIRFMDIHDINERPPLSELRKVLENLNK